MQAVITAFAETLRRQDLPSAHSAAALLEGLTPAAGDGAGATFIPPWLGDTLAAVDAHPLVTHFAPHATAVPWVQVTSTTMPAGFAGRYAFSEIAGPGCPFPSTQIAFGAYLQYPDTWYPRHWHAAEELYFVLSGTALWTRNGVAGAPAPPGTLIRHASFEHHATRTLAEPLLAFWIWLGDLDFASYGIEEA